jgi:hypothetical protein
VDWYDSSLYPDVKDPRPPATAGERIDFLARLCGAWDFGILPDPQTLAAVRRPEWREAVEECRLLTSCSYHLLRRLHGLPNAPFLGSIPAFVAEDPSLTYI